MMKSFLVMQILTHQKSKRDFSGFRYGDTLKDENDEYSLGMVKDLTAEEVAHDKAELLARGYKRGLNPH